MYQANQLIMTGNFALQAKIPTTLWRCLLMQISSVMGMQVGIVGAQGELGRTLVQQCKDRDLTPVAFVRRPQDPIFPPSYSGWLSPAARPEDASTKLPDMRNIERVDTLNLQACCTADIDALIFTMSGKPFENDTTMETFRTLTAAKSERCNTMCLVSAHGVGDSVVNANVGIKIMRSWYLKDTYASKQQQEDIFAELRRTTNKSLIIVRPKVLSFEPIPFNPSATPRCALARDILDWCEWDYSKRR